MREILLYKLVWFNTVLNEESIIYAEEEEVDDIVNTFELMNVPLTKELVTETIYNLKIWDPDEEDYIDGWSTDLALFEGRIEKCRKYDIEYKLYRYN